MLMLKHQPLNQVSMIQVQHYVRSEKWIGIITLTTLESEFAEGQARLRAVPQTCAHCAARACTDPYHPAAGALSCEPSREPNRTPSHDKIKRYSCTTRSIDIHGVSAHRRG